MASHAYKIVRLDSGKRTAAEQMQIDQQYLISFNPPTLRFYEWQGFAFTYGYFIDPGLWLKSGSTLDSARRPTGGGLIFHEDDLSFTLVVDSQHPLSQLPVLERYQLVNNQVKQAILSLCPYLDLALQNKEVLGETIDDLCMANPTKYDLLLGIKKVGGAAQRKNRRSLIHQCSLFLREPEWDKIAAALVDPDRILPTLQRHTSSLLACAKENIIEFQSELKNKIFNKIKEII